MTSSPLVDGDRSHSVDEEAVVEDLFPRARIALVATMVVLGSAILIGVDGPPSERHVDAASPVASPSPATPATGGAAIASPVAGGTSALVEIRNDDYEPGGLRLSVGDSVRWVNRDGVTHTVSANDGSFDSGPMHRGEVFTHTFDVPGTFSYSCDLHLEMSGVVVVSGR